LCRIRRGEEFSSIKTSLENLHGNHPYTLPAKYIAPQATGLIPEKTHKPLASSTGNPPSTIKIHPKPCT
jgi:hypothetical protein